MILDELKKPSSELLPKPIDIVGDGEQQPEKKKKKKKTEKKKTWSREEILSTFLPPEKQTKKPKRGVSTPATEKKEKKHFPAAVMKQPAETPSAPSGEENGKDTRNLSRVEKSRVIQETMKSIRMDHVPAWAKSSFADNLSFRRHVGERSRRPCSESCLGSHQALLCLLTNTPL